MTTTCTVHASTTDAVLHVAFELSQNEWKLAFTTGLGQPQRLRSVPARDRQAVLKEIGLARQRFGLPAEAVVASCYEAGRDGFWLHRWLSSVGVRNVVFDSASIEVNRKKRRAKSDRLDASALVRLLVRYHQGDDTVCSVARVPEETAEDERHLRRELIALKDERTNLGNQMKGHLSGQGLVLLTVTAKFPEWLAQVRRWNGEALLPELRARLLRIFARWQLLHRQILDLELLQRQRIRQAPTPQVEQVRRLLELKGIGRCGAWMLVKELFGWRRGFNRKQLSSLLGLTPTPYSSGQSRREQGISKAGNKRLRRLLIELAWGWLRHQPGSVLSRWFERRFVPRFSPQEAPVPNEAASKPTRERTKWTLSGQRCPSRPRGAYFSPQPSLSYP